MEWLKSGGILKPEMTEFTDVGLEEREEPGINSKIPGLSIQRKNREST